MGMATKGKAKLKMVALTAGKQPNITWYSPDWQNDKPNDVIIVGMLRRLQAKPIMDQVQVIQFWENSTLYHEIKRPK